MDNNRAAIIRELVVIVVVASLLLTAAGFLVRNVVVAVRSLDGAQATESVSLDDLEKALRDLAGRFIPAGGQKSPPAPAPAAQPNPPAAENKKSEVTSVRFFEAGKDVPQRQLRQYADQFSRQARNIYIEIAYKNGAYKVADASIPLDIRCLDPAGRPAGELKSVAKPKKEWASAVYTSALGAPATAGWTSGQYIVKLFFDGEYSGEYRFTID